MNKYCLRKVFLKDEYFDVHENHSISDLYLLNVGCDNTRDLVFLHLRITATIWDKVFISHSFLSVFFYPFLSSFACHKRACLYFPSYHLPDVLYNMKWKWDWREKKLINEMRKAEGIKELFFCFVLEEKMFTLSIHLLHSLTSFLFVFCILFRSFILLLSRIFFHFSVFIFISFCLMQNKRAKKKIMVEWGEEACYRRRSGNFF